MADSKRLAVLKRLTAHLQGITPENGYEYDLSAAVFRGKSVFGADMPLPCLSVLEHPKPDTGIFAGQGKRAFTEEWVLMLQGWVEDDEENPTDPAYGLEAAVRKRLYDIMAQTNGGQPKYPDVYMLGKLISDIAIGPPVVRPPDNQVSSKAFFFLPLRVSLQTDVSQPYVTA